MKPILFFSCLGVLAACTTEKADSQPTDTAISAEPENQEEPEGPDEPGNPESLVDEAFSDSVFVLNVAESTADWVDFAYLAATPTSAIVNQGSPAIVAISDSDETLPSTQDLLARLNPQTAIVLNDATMESVGNQHSIVAENASQFSMQLCTDIWESAATVIFASENDYAGAVLASSVASLMEAPLIFADNLSDDEISSLLSSLGTTTVISVSLDGSSITLPVDHEQLQGTEVVIDWLAEQDIWPQYLAVTNPNDRTSGRAQKASLVAAMFAAKRLGLVIPVSLEMPTETLTEGQTHPVVSYLDGLYDQMGYHPEFLAIVGAHDALPLSRKPSIFNNPVNEHPVSDLPYGEVDDDPFLDIAIGRIIGDNIFELSNLATRTATYEKLQDDHWENRFIESGLWGFDELRPLMLNVGFEAPEHLTQQQISSRASLEVGAILHKDHSYCQVLGHAFEIYTPTLFAPAIVISRGCSVGGVDLLPASSRSIVDHMLGQGAVAFVGASRNSIAYNTIIEVSLWNHLLDGQTVGQAFRSGINDTIVHWRDDNSSAFRYSLDIEVLFDDPAWEMFVPDDYQNQPAHHSQQDSLVSIFPPEQWSLIAFMPEQLAEWNFTGDLFMYAGPGAIPKTYWAGAHDAEDLYYGVKIDRETAPTSVTQQTSHDSPLGWSGNYYIDEHQDGTVSVHWGVRLIDYDMYTGDMTAQSPHFDYLVE